MQHSARLHAGEAPRSTQSLGVGWLLVFLLIVCAPFAVSAEEAFDLTVVQNDCVWTGPVDLDDPNFSLGCAATFTGTMTLDRVAGTDPNCPATISGNVEGTVSGSAINFGVAGGTFGEVDFTGTFTITPDGEGASGTWDGDPGTGTWFAVDFMGFGGGTVILTMIRPAGPCEWTGPISGTGAVTIEGSMALTRIAGAAPCPTNVSGDLTGKLFGAAICFAVDSPEFKETITFIGTVDRQAYSGSGTWSGDSSGRGTWTTRFARSVHAAILSHAGLALLLGLLLLAGILSFRRQPD